MIKLSISPELQARSLILSDADKVIALIEQNREHLDRWLRWSSSLQSRSSVVSFIKSFVAKEEAGDGFHLGLWLGDQLIGGVVCWYIHIENRNAEIGYWLGKDYTGNGYATLSAKAILAHLLIENNVHRVEMQCGVSNESSRGVAERCGLTLEGVRRESHWITDRFVDHAVYSILEREWPQD